MPKTPVMEYFPAHMLTLELLQQVLAEVDAEFDRQALERSERVAWSAEAGETWPRLQRIVRNAAEDAFVRGAAAVNRWVGRETRAWNGIRRRLGCRDLREVRACYLSYLDSIYGRLYRQVLSHVTAALCTQCGHITLERVRYRRPARIPHLGDSLLRLLLDLLVEGGPLLELEFLWQPLGEPGWWQTMG